MSARGLIWRCFIDLHGVRYCSMEAAAFATSQPQTEKFVKFVHDVALGVCSC